MRSHHRAQIVTAIGLNPNIDIVLIEALNHHTILLPAQTGTVNGSNRNALPIKASIDITSRTTLAILHSPEAEAVGSASTNRCCLRHGEGTWAWVIAILMIPILSPASNVQKNAGLVRGLLHLTGSRMWVLGHNIRDHVIDAVHHPRCYLIIR